MKEGRIRELFDEFAASYDEHMQKSNHQGTQKKLLDEFLPYIGEKVLDIATGTGLVAGHICRNTQSRVWGVDYSKNMIQTAKHRHPSITWVVADVHSLGFEDASFDTVTCAYGFSWFCDVHQAVQEIQRVLRRGGTLIVLEEEFFVQDNTPAFAKLSNMHQELASLETFRSSTHMRSLLTERGFSLRKEARQAVDELHETVGMAFVMEHSPPEPPPEIYEVRRVRLLF